MAKKGTRNVTRSMVHLNNNILCAIDLETTGLRPEYHEIIQIAIVPLDQNLEPRADLPIFDQKIRPAYPHRVDYEALRVSRTQLNDICNTGLPGEKVFDLFTYWFNKLKLGLYKKIVPLGYNCASFDMNFIYHWMGRESYQSYFHGYTRDVMLLANMLNDVSDFHAEQTPFTELKLRAIARSVGVEVIDGQTHDAVYDAYLAAQVYKQMLTHHLWEGYRDFNSPSDPGQTGTGDPNLPVQGVTPQPE